MPKKTITLHKYAKTGQYNQPGDVCVYDFDFRTVEECMRDRIYLGSEEVELDFPDIDIRESQIEKLEKQIEEVKLKSKKEVNLLLDRISNLRAIGHD